MGALSVLMLLQFASFPSGTVTLDEKKQLFLDDSLIASMKNVVRRIHPAEKHSGNPLLWPEEPWEGEVALTHGSVIRDGDRYRMWYLSGPGVSYAESEDGIRWEKPSLDVFTIDGRKTNAVIRRDATAEAPNFLSYFGELAGVRRDPGEKDASRRYKMGFISIQRDYKGPHEDLFHRGQRRGLGVAGSPDGLHWKLIDNWATEAICDGPGHWMFDPALQKYVLFGRTKSVAPDVARLWSADEWCRKNCWGRSVTRVESADFVHWDITERGAGPVALTPDARDPVGTEIYSMHVFPYEGVYIGLVQIFHNQPDECCLDVQLAVSRDGVEFARVGDRSPFIPLGPIGSWDRFNNSLANNPPLLVGDELRFYYSGRTYRHSPYAGPDRGVSGGGIGLATIRRDRFVSLGASFAGGEIVTKPIRPGGKVLHLNAKSDYGRIDIEVIGEDGNVVARSQPIVKDSLDVAVAWEQGTLEGLDGPATLRITLANALLFAIWCS